MHEIVIGTTLSGKSYLVKRRAFDFHKAGHPVFVFDGLGASWDFADFQTDDPEEFLQVLLANDGGLIVIDDPGGVINKYDQQQDWYGTKSRHFGYKCIISTQRGAQISKTLKTQATTLYLFSTNIDDAKEWAKEFGFKELENAVNLPQYCYYKVGRFNKDSKIYRLKA